MENFFSRTELKENVVKIERLENEEIRWKWRNLPIERIHAFILTERTTKDKKIDFCNRFKRGHGAIVSGWSLTKEDVQRLLSTLKNIDKAEKKKKGAWEVVN